MLTRYIQASLRHAHYELTEDGRFFGSIPPCPGVWAEGATLEECREDLASALESWMIVGLRQGDAFEPVDGIDINPRPAHAETHQAA